MPPARNRRTARRAARAGRTNRDQPAGYRQTDLQGLSFYVHTRRRAVGAQFTCSTGLVVSQRAPAIGAQPNRLRERDLKRTRHRHNLAKTVRTRGWPDDRLESRRGSLLERPGRRLLPDFTEPQFRARDHHRATSSPGNSKAKTRAEERRRMGVTAGGTHAAGADAKEPVS